VTSWNTASERMYGYSRAEMVGQSVSRIFPPGQAGELAFHYGSGAAGRADQASGDAADTPRRNGDRRVGVGDTAYRAGLIARSIETVDGGRPQPRPGFGHSHDLSRSVAVISTFKAPERGPHWTGCRAPIRAARCQLPPTTTADIDGQMTGQMILPGIRRA
jgi:hypothetical protein